MIARGRLDPGTDAITFIDLVVTSRDLKVLPITAEVANLSATYRGFTHADPADRIIASTELFFKVTLLTPDARLRAVRGLKVLWTWEKGARATPCQPDAAFERIPANYRIGISAFLLNPRP